MAEKIVTCPHCNQKLSIEEEYLGMEFDCPTCSKRFATVVPVEQAADEANALNDTETVVDVVDEDDSVAEDVSDASEGPNILECRKVCKKYFSALKVENHALSFLRVVAFFLEYIFFFVLIIRVILKWNTRHVVNCFRKLREYDIDFLEKLDVLPRYGKSSEQLAAEVHTLYSPAIEYGEDSEFKSDLIDTGDDNFEYIYSTEAVTKVYTFEDQLFIYSGLWDYTAGQIVHEKTDVFFFRDITNIVSENEFIMMKAQRPPFKFRECISKIVGFFKRYKKLVFISAIILFVIPAAIFLCFGEPELAAAFVTIFPIMFYLGLAVDFIVIKFLIWLFIRFFKGCDWGYFRKSETLIITAKSGCSISITILCNEWLEANHGILTGQRSDGEKIFHSIRKMIEEKKAVFNE